METILSWVFGIIIAAYSGWAFVKFWRQYRLEERANKERTALVRYLYNRDHGDERHSRYASSFGRVTFGRHIEVLKAGGDPLELYGLLGEHYKLESNGH